MKCKIASGGNSRGCFRSRLNVQPSGGQLLLHRRSLFDQVHHRVAHLPLGAKLFAGNGKGNLVIGRFGFGLNQIGDRLFGRDMHDVLARENRSDRLFFNRSIGRCTWPRTEKMPRNGQLARNAATTLRIRQAFRRHDDKDRLVTSGMGILPVVHSPTHSPTHSSTHKQLTAGHLSLRRLLQYWACSRLNLQGSERTFWLAQVHCV